MSSLSNLDSTSNNSIQSELYFLIAHFLNNSQFESVAKQFIQELEKKQLLPKRLDWTGKEHSRSYDELVQIYKHIPSNFLLLSQNQLLTALDKLLQFKISNVNTLLGSGQYSILQNLNQLDNKKQSKITNIDALPKDLFLNYHSSNSNNFNVSKKSLNGGINVLLNLDKRQLCGKLDTLNIIQPELFRSINPHIRILGHLSAVYCVCFDRSGRFILTGADDHLIKAWNTHDGRLMATFRGHQKEISDIDINYENTLLASGSCDKTIRIWNLKTTESITILQGHSSMVTSVEFSPSCRGEDRWLASSGNDGTICFWQWNSRTLNFIPKPKKFIEKSRPGSQILCLSFSSGGAFLAAGSNDHAIRVYYFDENVPIKICELESHTDVVDSIQYANNSARFLSGSKDGTARIWKYESQKWRPLVINVGKTLQRNDDQDEFSNHGIYKKCSVTMVTWNCDDSLVATAQSNFLIKIWNSNDAELVHELNGHKGEVFVLEAHPRDPRLLLSAGHDGYVILWNILTAKIIKRFYNRIENEGHGCLFDTKWSPNLDMFAATDSHGYLTFYGFGNGDSYSNIPREQFFHSDYRPLMHDLNGFAVDEQTQQPPHLMPPPFLINADGNPYPAEYQRLVPGRENLTDAQLTPHTITNENGVAEIIGDSEHPEENPNDNQNENSENVNNLNNRRRFLWVKDLIRPLNPVVLSTNEANRLVKLELEENYFIEQYRKELKSKDLKKVVPLIHTFGDIDVQNRNNNSNDKRPGRRSKNNYDNDRNRVISRVDSDYEDRNSRGPTTNFLSEYDEETMDTQYIDVDDDSNTQHSIGANFLINNNNNNNNNNVNPTTSSRANNRNNTTPYSNINTNYIDPLELASETESSEYSDWAEEGGRKTLKPLTATKSRRANAPAALPRSTREQRSNRRNQRRTLRVLDDDDTDQNNSAQQQNENLEEENDIILSKSTRNTRNTTTRAKKAVKRITSDDDEKEEDNGDENLYDNEMDESSNEEEDNNEDDDEDEDEDETEEENDENLDPNKPCTSHSLRNQSSSKSPSKRGRKPKNHLKNSASISSNISKTFNRKSSKSSKGKLPRVTDCPQEFRPPEWLTSSKPRKTPYMPQIGDEVIYFRQGHELYVTAVRTSKVYELEDKAVPWIHNKNINVQEYCKVIGMKIEIKPPRLVCLKLSIIDRVSGEQTGSNFEIKYHDMPHVVDFIILRQYYERSIEKNWKPKDRFRCIIDDTWYFGVIESKHPFQAEYPDSQFQCLNVLWDSGDKEALSPWDLEPLNTSGINTRNKSKQQASSNSLAASTSTSTSNTTPTETTPVTVEELRSLMYVAKENEWHDGNRDAESQRILGGLQRIMELSIAEPFTYPVDLDSFPDYAIVIPYPIDLNTIKERIANGFYRRLSALEWDVRMIEKNATRYNEIDSEIVRNATLLNDVIVEFINDPHCSNPIPIYRRLNKNIEKNITILNTSQASIGKRGRPPMKASNNEENSEENDSDHNKEISNNRSTRASRSHFNLRSIHNRTSSISGGQSSLKPQHHHQQQKTNNSKESSKNSWQSSCKKLISDILKHPDSLPFRDPVNLEEYPDYLEQVDEMVDFGMIMDKLRNGVYDDDGNEDGLKKFDSECKLLFLNSKTYNTNKRSTIYGMTLRLQALYESRIKEIKNQRKKDFKYEKSRYGRKIKMKYNFDNSLISDPNAKDKQYGSRLASKIVDATSNLKHTRQSLEVNGPSSISASQSYPTRSSNRTRQQSKQSLNNENSSNYFADNNTANTSKELNENSFDRDNVEYELNENNSDHSINETNSKKPRLSNAHQFDDNSHSQSSNNRQTGGQKTSFNLNLRLTRCEGSTTTITTTTQESLCNDSEQKEAFAGPCSSKSTRYSSTRSQRISRADSETVLSYNDAVENEADNLLNSASINGKTNHDTDDVDDDNEESFENKKSSKLTIADLTSETSKRRPGRRSKKNEKESDDDENTNEHDDSLDRSADKKLKKTRGKSKKKSNHLLTDNEDDVNNSENEEYKVDEDLDDDDEDDGELEEEEEDSEFDDDDEDYEHKSGSRGRGKRSSQKKSSGRLSKNTRQKQRQNLDNKENNDVKVKSKNESIYGSDEFESYDLQTNARQKINGSSSKSSFNTNSKKSSTRQSNHSSSSKTRSSKRTRRSGVTYKESSSSGEQDDDLSQDDTYNEEDDESEFAGSARLSRSTRKKFKVK